MTKPCRKCAAVKPLDQFYASSRNKDGKANSCVECDQKRFKAYYEANREAVATKARLRRYGLDGKTYKRMLEAQEGSCAICSVLFNGIRPCVDHDHECCSGETGCGNCYRGLLCGWCNKGLGFFQDDADLLRMAAKYIDYHREKGRK